jgi:hypothetical protein
MELECVKYKEKMDSEGAYCRHPGDYCKDRSSCIIHFTGKEKKVVSTGNSADPVPEGGLNRKQAAVK